MEPGGLSLSTGAGASCPAPRRGCIPRPRPGRIHPNACFIPSPARQPPWRTPLKILAPLPPLFGPFHLFGPNFRFLSIWLAFRNPKHDKKANQDRHQSNSPIRGRVSPHHREIPAHGVRQRGLRGSNLSPRASIRSLYASLPLRATGGGPLAVPRPICWEKDSFHE